MSSNEMTEEERCANKQKKYKQPQLRDPGVPGGPAFTSVSAWVASASKPPQSHPPLPHSPQQADFIPPVATTEPPPVRVIISEPENTEINNNQDALDAAFGVEDFIFDNPFDDVDEDLDIEDDFMESEEIPKAKHARVRPPKWLSDVLKEKLQIVEKRDKLNKYSFYDEHESFWLPQKSNWFKMMKAKILGPELLYEQRWFFWDPMQLTRIQCPRERCNSWLTRHNICKRPRRCVDLNDGFWMIGARYKCPTCKNKSQKKTVTFMSWDSNIIKNLPKALSAEFPSVLTHRSGMADGLFSLQCSLLHKGLGTQQFRDILRVQHLRRFDQLQIQYLELIDYTRAACPWQNSTFGGFSSFDDPAGFAGYIPSSK